VSLRYRSLPDIPKPVVDRLEMEYEAARVLFPDFTDTFSQWLTAMLLNLTAALREARMAEEGRRGR
jgi:hypothetical protein